MSLLEELAAQAALGTERRRLVLPRVEGSLGAVLREIGEGDYGDEVRLLRAAAAIGWMELCGILPAPLPDAPSTGCPPESLRTVDEPELLATLARLFHDGPELLQVEALDLLARARSCPPPGLLPGLLDAALGSPALRRAARPVLGRRGEWLVERNPAWRAALAPDVAEADITAWETGTLEQRASYLTALRSRDREGARTLLQNELAALDARERTRLVEALRPNLASDDEPMLESLLADRSKEVRQLAGELLARLPESAFVRRMGERVAACLATERRFLRTVVVLEPPERFDAGWKADAIEEGRGKGEALGARAWWLYQMARHLPLAWWTERLEMKVEGLLAWAERGDWRLALLRAWLAALRRAGDAEWAVALLDQPSTADLALDRWELVALLPAAERERRWREMLAAGAARQPRGEVIAHVVATSARTRTPPSSRFVGDLLDTLRRALADAGTRWDQVLRGALVDLVCVVPVASLADFGRDWPVDRDETRYFADTVARALAVAEQRLVLHRHLASWEAP